jgi:Protein of unknown function (DUF2934)
MRMRASVDPSPFSGPRAAQAAEERQRAISSIAFRISAARGFEPGHELDDWVAAEREYDEGYHGA